MALAIKMDSPHRQEILSILHRFADHAEVCDTCSVKTGAHCDIGGAILHELTTFGEDVRPVPENWKGETHKPL